jgi:hypothetical protein
MADRVLHAPPPEGAEFTLYSRRRSRQSRVLFKPLCFKVLLTVDNIPMYLCLLEIVQAIMLACLSFEPAPASVSKSISKRGSI